MPTIAKTILVMLLLILLCALAVENVSASMLRKESAAQRPVIQATPAHPDVMRIMSVLEQKIGHDRLPEQAREKLENMPEQDLRLVASLCDRIAAAHDRAGTDIALFLAAVLIILS